jgi:hypothetical protein
VGPPTQVCAGPNPAAPGNPTANGIGIGTIQNDDATVQIGIVSIGSTIAGNINSVLEGDTGTFAIPVTFSSNGTFQGNTTISYTVTSGPPPPATVGAAASPPRDSAGNVVAASSSNAGSCSGTIDLYPSNTNTSLGTTGQNASGFTTAASGAANTTGGGLSNGGTQTINLIGCGDLRPELNENFTVTITSVTGPATISGANNTAPGACSGTNNVSCASKVGTIIDNDRLGAFGFSGPNLGDVSLPEGSNPGQTTPFPFTFTYGGVPADYQIVATLSTVDGTATSGGTPATGQDYQPLTCTVTFAAGSQTGVASPACTVLVNQDTQQETDETFTLQVTGFNTGVTAAGTACASSANPNGGGFTTAAGGTWAVLGNNANGAPICYVPSTGGNDAFGAGNNPAPFGTDLVAQGNILNDDGSPTVAINSISVLEGNSGVTPYTVRLTRTGTTTLASTVNIAVPTQTGTSGVSNPEPAQSDGPGAPGCGSANTSTQNNPNGTSPATVPGTDFLSMTTPIPVSFSNGAGTGQGFDFIDVTFGAQTNGGSATTGYTTTAGGICGDTRLENNETFQVVLTPGTNSTVPTVGGSGTVTILNDDSVTFTLTQNVTGNEGNDPANPTGFDYTLTRTGLTNLPTTLTYTLVGLAPTPNAGTAPATIGAAGTTTCAAGIDVLPTPTLINNQTGTSTSPFVVSNTGTLSQTVRVLVCGDTLAEPNEGFGLTVTATNSPGTTTGSTTATITATGTIINDDAGAPAGGFEGDINRTTPGTPGTGDGDVTIADVIQYNRFAQGLDCPAVGTANPALNEQQRLDAGPIATRGDGLLGSADGSAIDAYARHDASTDFDPATTGWQPTPAGGPTTISNLGCTPTARGEVLGEGARIETPEGADAQAAVRDFRIVNASGVRGSQVVVEVEGQFAGTEFGTQYSLHFDPTVLSISNVTGFGNPNVAPGAGAPATTTINVNAQNVAAGDIGIVENFGGTIPAGTRRITRLTFTVLNTAALGLSPVTFTNTVVTRQTVDALGNILSNGTYTDGNVNVVGPRSITIGSGTTRPGGVANIPVTLTTTAADAYSASTSVNFDPSLLSITAADITNGAGPFPPGCTFNVNTTGITTPGRIGLAVNCPTTGTPIPAGTSVMFNLKFTAKPALAAGTTTPLTAGNTPLNTEVGDVNGNTLPVTATNGSITILAPTAAAVSVSGNVFVPGGAGLRNATVTITDAAGNSRSVVTSSFGSFQFDDVMSGDSYVVRVISKRYKFAPRVVQVTDSLTGVDFTGIE